MSKTELYLCYFSNFSIKKLRPVLTLGPTLDLANQGDISIQTKLVRLNWMVNDLKTNKMKKPIFCDNKFNVIVGDTRLIALNLLGIENCAVLAQLDSPQGQVLTTEVELRETLGFSRTAEIICVPPSNGFFDSPVEWFEIGDESTGNHMHDESQRRRMIVNYVNDQPDDFKFTKEWCLNPIDWDKWDI